MRKSFATSPLRNNLSRTNTVVLGIDPGIANTGYAVVGRNTGKFVVLKNECIYIYQQALINVPPVRCEACELYGDDAVFDFGDWIGDVESPIEMEDLTLDER